MPLTSGGIYYADNSTSASIADITAAMATSINNTIAPTWTAYVPTLTNAVRSSGSLYYAVSGNVMHIIGKILVSSVSGVINFSIPSGWNINTSITFVPTGIAYLEDAGTSYYIAIPQVAGLSSISILVQHAGGTYAYPVNTSATVPFTWASGDSFHVNLTIPVTRV